MRRLLYKLYELYYQNVPHWIQYLISNKIRGVYLFIKYILYFLSNLKSDKYILEGKEKLSGQNLRVIYVGEELTLKYVCNLAFSMMPNIIYKEKIYSWRFDRDILEKEKKADLLFIMVSRLFVKQLNKKEFYVLPEWIGQSMELKSSIADTLKNLSGNSKEFIRKTKARIKKLNYTYKVSKKISDFDTFYNSFYLPFAKKRHKDAVEILSYDYLKTILSRGGLLFLQENDKHLAALLFIIDQSQTFHFYSWGIFNGEEKYLDEGVGHALYYFSIMYAIERGCKHFNFGGSRPFLSDGILQYKKKWGARVADNPWLNAVIGLKICNYNCSGVMSFLTNNGFISINNKNPAGHLFFDNDAFLSSNNFKNRLKQSIMRGLDDLFIHTPLIRDEIKERNLVKQYKKDIHLVNF